MKIDYIVDPYKYLLMPGFLELSIGFNVENRACFNYRWYTWYTSFRSVNNPDINNNEHQHAFLIIFIFIFFHKYCIIYDEYLL